MIAHLLVCYVDAYGLTWDQQGTTLHVQPVTPPHAILLAVRGLRKAFPGVQALDGVDFDLRAGEVHALVGENGAGKSTLIKILSGAVLPDQGVVEILGQPHRRLTPHQAQDLGIRTIYQERSLVPWMSVSENILLGNLPGWGFLVDAHALPRSHQHDGAPRPPSGSGR